MEPSNLHARLARQSLRRPLTPEEDALAAALKDIFAAGTHDFAAVAAELQSRKVKRPSGEAAAWTLETLEQELIRINASLDAAYDANDLM
jgi:hypothetical protein